MKNYTLWTALVTPLNGKGAVHFGDLEKIARRQEAAGNGILILGSTGEGLALSDAEKREVVDFVAGLGLKVPVMTGVGGFNLQAQREWITYCNDKTDAFLLVVPLYSKPGLIGQTEWFRQLLDDAHKPCMIYNIPSRTGVKLFPQVMASLKSHPNIWAMKEASGSLHDFQVFRETVPDIPLFSGDDALLPFFSAVGCKGLVSVCSNVWPDEVSLYTEKCLKGDTATLFPLWHTAVKTMFSASNPIPVKRLLKEKGWISLAALRPPLTEEELSSADALLAIDAQIKNWYQKNR
ncbi:MAG: 4-hydroxy-tetrahydrodipicolinate synthase [Balneolaceae bacterium]|nr:MAG: 4-hydroxy-tetrahydrodipicolinate synthase [Balneolaceae bacterium]